jgi:delta14-sterol reductase
MALTYALLVAVVGLALACDWRWFVVAARELGCSLTFRNVSLATLQLLVYIGVLALLSEALPGWVYPGTIPADGSKRIHYKCNGLAVLGSTVAIWAALGSGLGAWTWSYLADNVGAFLAAANLLAWSLATLLLLRQRWRSRASASTGPSQRSWLRDFILGAELNPHLGRFELKFFWLRPSMIGWMLLNLSIAAKQWHALGRVTTRMLLTQLIMNGYILDYFWHESKMTTTWDIVAEHFGLMLIWGDLVFIPFVFSTPAWCLVHDQRRMSVGLLLGTLITVVLGGWIFRSANSQKDAFKRDSQRPVSSWFVSWSRGIPRWHRLERETSQTG